MQRHPYLPTVAMTALVLLATMVAAPSGARASATPATDLRRSVAAVASPPGAVDVGAARPDDPMAVRVVLAPEDPAALEAFAIAVSTPGDPRYRQYLTSAEFADRFGAGDERIAAVRRTLAMAGLRSGALAPNRLSLTVEATVGDVAAALGTHFVETRLRDGSVVRRRDRTARIPDGVEAIVGLDDYPRHRKTATADPIPRPACTGAVATGGWTAPDLSTAYDAGSLHAHTAGGAGQTIALYELSTYKTSDITTAQQCFGSTGTVTRVPIGGGAGTSSGALEVTLDAGIVVGLAPSADVLVYEGPNTEVGAYDTFAAIVNENRAQVVSISWGLCEPLLTKSVAQAEAALFAQAAAQGQSLFAASGDDGSADCAGANGSSALAVDDPASQPFVTGVGGTSLSSVSPRAETVWNNGSGAGGGGLSQFWPAPSYQSGATTPFSSGTPCGSTTGNCRQVPDVSASADPQFGYPTFCSSRSCGSGWSRIGGTSGAAPLWAAFTATINEHCGAGQRVGFANPKLYGLPTLFNDIVVGDNDGTAVNGGRYPASVGYDLASGLGSPSVSSLAVALCGALPTGPVLRSAPQAVAFGSVVEGSSVSRTVRLRSIGDAVATPAGSVITGAGAGSFTVASDGCGAVEVPPTQSCDIVVSFAPTSPDLATANLDVPFGDGLVRISLSGSGITPTTTYAVSPDPVAFGSATIGATVSRTVVVTNTGGADLQVGSILVSGGPVFSKVEDACSGSVLVAGHACSLTLAFHPSTAATVAGTLTVPDAAHTGVTRVVQLTGTGTVAPTTTTTTTTAPVTTTTLPPPTTTTTVRPAPAPAPRHGYWMIGQDGDTYAFGDARWFGNTGGRNVVDLEPTPSGNGYWTVDAVGAVRSFGDAPYRGGSPTLQPFEAVTSISATRAGDGYWLFTTFGRVLPYGTARFFGDMAGTRLNGPVLDSIPTASGNGYYMVASDGGIFTFGDAVFDGSMGGQHLNAPVQSLVPDPDGIGYWLVASDGGIFSFDAAFHGSMGSVRLNRPITGMVASGAAGYLMVAEDGGIFTFGDAVFDGSLGASPPAAPITSVAAFPGS
jgi:hypothetical protein